MPIYEYRCEDCGRKQSVLTLRISQTPDPVCRRCGGWRMRRLFSRVALLTSEEDRLERLADPSAWGDLDEDDPASVARFARRLGEAVGEDLREEIEQAMDEEFAGGGKGDDGDGEPGGRGGPGTAGGLESDGPAADGAGEETA
jgi:putative FmdB family regulatory protein